MKRLFEIELYKLWKNKSSRVLIILSFVLPFTIALITSIKIDLGVVELNPAEYGIFNFPFIWHWNTYFASVFKVFFALVAISMIANEYNYGTLKQNLIDGMSKREMILSKFYVIIIYSLVSMLGIFIMSLIVGSIYSVYDEFSIIATDLEYFLAYFLKLVAFFSFCMFVTMLVRKSVFAIGLTIILSAVEWITYAYMRYEIFNDTTLPREQSLELGYNAAENISQFFPLMSMYNLVEPPFLRYGQIMSGQAIDIPFDYEVHLSEILIAMAWTAIFVYGAYALLKKRDL
jgi:ABC-type transport system involved in multi-copper enzyme maturation permease subunit